MAEGPSFAVKLMFLLGASPLSHHVTQTNLVTLLSLGFLIYRMGTIPELAVCCRVTNIPNCHSRKQCTHDRLVVSVD